MIGVKDSLHSLSSSPALKLIAKQCECEGEYYQSNIQVKPCVDDNENQGGGNFQKTKTLVVDVGEKN